MKIREITKEDMRFYITFMETEGGDSTQVELDTSLSAIYIPLINAALEKTRSEFKAFSAWICTGVDEYAPLGAYIDSAAKVRLRRVTDITLLLSEYAAKPYYKVLLTGYVPGAVSQAAIAAQAALCYKHHKEIYPADFFYTGDKPIHECAALFEEVFNIYEKNWIAF